VARGGGGGAKLWQDEEEEEEEEEAPSCGKRRRRTAPLGGQVAGRSRIASRRSVPSWGVYAPLHCSVFQS
jgi:hypothetical protein